MIRTLSDILAEIGDEIEENKVAKGWRVTRDADWGQTDHIPAVLALIHSEVSEALEAFRKDDLDGFRGELADVMIRVIGLAHGMAFDLGGAILYKMEKNRTREFRHGGKKL